MFKVLVLYLRRIEIMTNFRLLEKYKLSIFVKILRKIITKMYFPASGGRKKRDKNKFDQFNRRQKNRRGAQKKKNQMEIFLKR